MYSTCRFIVSPDSSEEACGCNGDDNYGNYGDDDELDGGDGDDDDLDGGDGNDDDVDGGDGDDEVECWRKHCAGHSPAFNLPLHFSQHPYRPFSSSQSSSRSFFITII